MSHRLKAFCTILCLQCLCVGVTAQDLLVNSQRDSLNVKVTKIERGYIYYMMAGSQEVVPYAVNRVLTYRPDYYSSLNQKPLSPIETETLQETEPKNDIPHNQHVDSRDSQVFQLNNVRLSGQVGLSRMLAPTDPELSKVEKEYIEGLRTGINYAIELDLFFHKFLGFGGRYSFFNVSNEMHEYTVTSSSGSAVKGMLADELFIHSAEAKLTGRFPIEHNRLIVYGYISIGRVWYNDKQHFGGYTYRLKAATYTGNSGIGIDFRIDETFGIGFQTSAMLGSIKDVNLEIGNGYGHSVPGAQNISRLDLSLGIRWFM